MVKRILCRVMIFLLSLAACHESVGQEVVLNRTKERPRIDGLIDDEPWKYASGFSDFKTMNPEPGLAPSEKTKVYLTYNQTEIFIAFECYDREPDRIVTGSAGKDNPGNDDWIAFCLDTFNDELGAYFFMVTPLGEKTDGTLNADGSPGLTFSTGWSAAGRLTEFGYTAEIAIPFKSLAYDWQKELTMGFKIARFISRKEEEVDFPMILPDRAPHLSQFQRND